MIGIGGCWSQSMKEQVFELFPFVDVAFGPGQVHKLAEFLTSDSLTAQGYFEFEGFTGHLPMKRERDFQAWVQISVGCNCACSYCIVPSTRGREVSRPAAELVAEVERLAADGVREVTLLGPERLLLRPRPAEGGEDHASPSFCPMIDAIDGMERIRYTSPHPKDIREDVIRAHAELPSVCEHIHLPLQSGSSPRPQGDAPHLQPRALPRPRGDDPRARARLRAHHRHHRRLPGRDRGRLRGDDGGGRAGALRLGVHVHLLAAARDAGRRRSTASCRTTSSASAWSGWSRRCSGTPPSARSASSGRTMEVLVEGPSRTDPAKLRGRIRHNKTVNFTGVAAPGELTEVEIASATSTTLAGEERLLARSAERAR